MAKARKHKKITTRTSGAQRTISASQNGTVQSAVATATAPAMRTTGRKNPLSSPAALKMQNLIFPGMIALGCWGMAFSFAFLSTDSNHVLIGGMAALMAILWSVNFGVRIRKVLAQRQRIRQSL